MTKAQNPKHVWDFARPPGLRPGEVGRGFRILGLFRVSPARLDFVQAKSGGDLGFRISRPGVALLLAVLILSALLAIGLGVFDVVFGEIRITEELSDSFVALSAADQGIEQLLYNDLVADALPGCGGSSPCTYSPASSFDFGNQRCAKLSLRRTGNGQTSAESIGEYRCGSERSVKRRLVTSYQKAAAGGFSPDTEGDLESGLVAYWPMDEVSNGSGPVQRNDVRGSNHLTDNNTVTSNPGRVGNAAQFVRANTEYLSIADNADLRTGNIDYTWAVWVNPDTVAADRSIISKWNSGSNGEYLLRIDTAGGTAAFYITNGTTFTAVTRPSVFTAGQWHLVIFYHDSVNDEIGISIDGDTPTTIPWANGSIGSAVPFMVGVDNGNLGVTNFDVRIDEVGFWKRVLTVQERADLWNNDNGNTCAAPCQ